ncbi:MAG: hypothetical protein IT178_07985 [Acidobacteria bacterium]|nr:hypothetical protein [Acidobacteriota bacterium]
MSRLLRAAVIVVGLAVLTGGFARRGLAAQSPEDALPPALVAMAEAERAFSARASERTPRDAFIEFFADEAVSFQPEPGPARPRLRAQTAPPPGAPAFSWEPRLGDVAASGDLGYLTGPVRFPQKDGGVRHGCYFSVWKKQSDGTFKVLLDAGVQPPGEVSFAPGLVRASARGTRPPVKDTSGRAEAESSLLDADRAFSAALAAKGAAAAFGETMHANGRLHRNGALPMTTRDDAMTWLREHVKAMTSEPMKSETGASGELGYTWGRASITAADDKPQAVHYIRVWTRDVSGRWWIVADVTPA